MRFEKSADLKLDSLFLKLSGFLNESADLGTYEFEKIKMLSIDFSQFELINSRGIMIWIRWFHEARRANKDLKITFSNCPKILVDQFNLINSLLPKNTKVKSFALPMVCPDCDHEISVILYEGSEFVLRPQAGVYDVKIPERNCPKCNASMKTEVSPQKYFQFLKAEK